MNFVLPASQCDLQWTQLERNLLGAVCYIGIILSAHFWGCLGDSIGRKKVLCPTLLVGFFVTVCSSFSNSFAVMFTLRLINGIWFVSFLFLPFSPKYVNQNISVSGATSVVLVYLGEFHSQKFRDKSIMICCFIMSIFTLLTPVLAWGIINEEWSFYIAWLNMTYTPWRLFMVVCATPGLLSGLLMLMLPESPKYLLFKNEEKQALDVLSKVYAMNTRRDSSVYPVLGLKKEVSTLDGDLIKMKFKNAVEVMWNRTKPLFSKNHLKDTTVYCILQFILYSSNFGMFVFFPDVINSVEQYLQENGNSSRICEIYELKLQQVYGQVEEEDTCDRSLELSTYTYSFICELAYFLGYLLLVFIIKKVPKNYILGNGSNFIYSVSKKIFFQPQF